MFKVYGVAIRKGGQGKSTTVSTLARLCALYGARVLVVDLAQPGTTTASLRDLWPAVEHDDLSNLLLGFRSLPPRAAPDVAQAGAALRAAGLPVTLESQPSWSGGAISVVPWDESQGDAAVYVQSERVLAGLLAALADQIDLALVDVPAESGPLLTTALAATNSLLMPLAPETPALEGAYATLRLLAHTRARGYPVQLGGIVLTRCDPKNKRMFDVVQALLQADEVEGESLRQRLLPFAIRHNEFFEQAFRYGEPIWERTSNPSHWAGYVLLAEWLLRDAGLAHLAQPTRRRGPALLLPDTRILDVSSHLLDTPDLAYADFERAHPHSPSRGTARPGG
jgi:chromosome partitioning protein